MRRVIATAGLAVLMGLLAQSCSAASGDGDVTTTTASETTTSPTTPPALDDGQYFAFVEVGTDESDQITIGVDVAELLTGEEARQAAIEAGVIGADEDLPNDFFILNEDQQFELLHATADARFLLISANDTSHLIDLGREQIKDAYDGGYEDPIYGAPGVPIPMLVDVVDGEITGAEQVYLP